MNKKHLGIIFLLLFVLAEALDIIILKSAFLKGAKPYILVYQVLLLSSVFMFIYIFFISKKQKLKYEKKDIPTIITIGVLANGIGDLFWLLGLRLSTASSFGFLNKLNVVFMILFASFILKEHFSRKKGIILGLILVGGYLISIKAQSLTPQLGDLFVVAGVVCFALSHVLSKKINTRNSPHYLALSRSFCGFLVLFIASLILFEDVFVFTFWPYVILDATIIFLLFFFFYKSLELKSASYVGLFGTITPVIVAVIAFFMFGEILTIIQLVGAIIIIISVVALEKSKVA